MLTDSVDSAQEFHQGIAGWLASAPQYLGPWFGTGILQRLLRTVVPGLGLLKAKDCWLECPHAVSACGLGFLTTWSLRVVRPLTWWLQAPSTRVTSPFLTHLESHIM